MLEFLKEIQPISSMITLFGVLLTLLVTVIYTRKNLRTTKYIETITTERIKWISIIREEISILVSNIYQTLKLYDNSIKDRKFESQGNEPSLIDIIENQNGPFDVHTSLAFSKQKNNWSQSDFIKHLNLLKLRLNSKEDIKIIDILDFFINFYMHTELLSDEKISEAEKNLNNLLEQTHKLLKNEWEKVKYETIGSKRALKKYRRTNYID